MSLQTFHCHSIISLYSNSRDVINIITLCVILILALTVTHGQRSKFAIFLPVSGLPFLLLAPRLSSRSFIRKLYKGESGEIYCLLVPCFRHRHHCCKSCAPLNSCTAPVHKLSMRIKTCAHKNKMGKSHTANSATSWVPSDFQQKDLDKARANGLVHDDDQVTFPSTECIPKPPSGLPGDVFCFSLARSVSPCPRVPSWASFCVRCTFQIVDIFWLGKSFSSI
jgi:hypothetical protein